MADKLELGFAKLQGEDFEYYMQSYSIILGRNSKKSYVDVDLALGRGGGMNISRQHAKIFYDFDRKGFVLEVLGKNGCYVDGNHIQPGLEPVKLNSQELLQIGDKKFYFLLPVVSKKSSRAASAGAAGSSRKRPASAGRTSKASLEDGTSQPPPPKRRSQPKGEGSSGRGRKEPGVVPHAGEAAGSSSAHGPSSITEPRRRADSESDSAAVQLEDRDVLSAASTALAEHTNPGEWMPLAKLYSELTEHCSHICTPAVLQRHLPPEAGNNADSEVKLKPWAGLLALLKRYPQRFIINTKLKGRITAEYVSLVAEHP